MKALSIDQEYLLDLLFKLLGIPSPAGYTDAIVRFVCQELQQLGIGYELTRRGAIRADLKGEQASPDRAVVAHLDTIGAMVTALKPNGRLGVCPIGTWSSRFAEGARVTVFSDTMKHRGTLLPLLASGHVYGDAVDKQPIDWEQLELRVDLPVTTAEHLRECGLEVGDYVAIDPQPERTDTGYIAERHLDDKAGVACVLAAAKALVEARATLPVDCHLLFTIFEEVGSGASAILHQDVAEMVSVDNATVAPGQNSDEQQVHVALMDSAGPYDYHLSHKLIDLANHHSIPIRREVFRYYRSDAATAVEAGNDIRTALLCFAVDGSHGHERTHEVGLRRLSELIALYAQSPPTFERDRMQLGPLKGFPTSKPHQRGH